MIASIKGKITSILPQSVVVEAGGIGYELFVTKLDLAKLKANQNIELNVFEYLRDEKHELYGFIDQEAKLLFEQLISVSGVGPKLAMTLLSAIPASKIGDAIAAGNTALLESVSGVGGRTASRIVVELKNKVIGDAKNFVDVASEQIVVDALRRLGYPQRQAAAAVKDLPENLKSDEEKIKQALKIISSK